MRVPTRAVGWSRRVYLAIAAAAALAVAGFGPAVSTAGAAEAPAHTDVMLVFDTSGSMGGVLEEAKSEIVGVMNQINGELPDAKFGVAEVRDIPFGANEKEVEESFEKPWKLDQPLTSDLNAVKAAIEPLFAEGGGDLPETYGRALWETDTNPNVGWRENARHVIILIADNVPHDNDLNEGIPSNLWAANEETGMVENPFDTGEELPGKWGIPGTQWTPSTNLDFQSIARQLGTDGKPLGMVDFQGGETGYLPYWEYWAGLSGGKAVSAESGEVAAKLTSLVEATSCSGACEKPPPPKHDTSSQVICNLVIATASDTCTATVGDAASSGATNPTGTVTFASANGGVFSAGNTCSLSPTPMSGNTSSCSVQFLPPTASSSFPAITATYGGDSTHNGSSAQTNYGPASSLEHLVDLSEAGTIKPGGTVEIPIDCEFPCSTSGELFNEPDFANIASVASFDGQLEAVATEAGKHHKKHKKKPVLLGKGTIKLSKPGKGKLLITPTAKGRRALKGVKKGRHVRLTLKLTVDTINGTLVVKKTQHVTLRPQVKKKGHKKHH